MLDSRILKFGLRADSVLLKLGSTVRGLSTPISNPVFATDRQDLCSVSCPTGFYGLAAKCKTMGSTNYNTKIVVTGGRLRRIRFGKVRAAI